MEKRAIVAEELTKFYGKARGIGLGLAIALYFMNIIANLSSKAEALKYITPFGYAESSGIINRGGLETDKLLIGLALAAAGIGLAYWKYGRKDIR